ncbi:MAG: cation:proton antiporter [bacterium]|nr:cation:proton antiporter [bacterium]
MFILLTAVWFSRKLFKLVKFPSMFGEVFAGVLVGPAILGWVGETEAIQMLAELGIFFLMFHSGLEMTPHDLLRASKKGLWVALGSVVPFAGGFFLSRWYGYDVNTSLFVAMGLATTAVTITTRLFRDLKILHHQVSHVTNGAAIINEVFVLVLFSVILDLAQTGNVDPLHIMGLVAKVLLYFLLVFYLGQRCFQYLYKVLYKGNKGFTFTLIVALFFGVMAELIGLHMIIGAFMAGLFIRRELLDPEVYAKIEDRVFGLSYSFLGPIFFATLAFHLDFSAFYSAPWFVFWIFVIAVLGKLIGSALPALWSGMSRIESLAVSVAMNGRGAVELIIASLGLQAGIISEEIFSVLVIIAFGTTLLSIISLKLLVPYLLDKGAQMTLWEKMKKVVT